MVPMTGMIFEMSQSDCNKRGESHDSGGDSPENPSKVLKTDEADEDSGISATPGSSSGSEGDSLEVNKSFEEIKEKCQRLAIYIVNSVVGENDSPSDEVDETLLRCVKSMMKKHEILFKGMMKRISITDETAYTAFLTVANELFEGDKLIVNWGRIIALYSFGGQLALHCREKNLNECGLRIPAYVGRYARDVISSFVQKEGGWKKLCEEFPPDDDMDKKVWRFLTWTAVGLGLATAASFLTSH